MNGIGVGGAYPAQPGIPQQQAQQQPGGQQQPSQPGGPPRHHNSFQATGPAQLGGQRPLGMVNGVGVAMGPRPVAGPGRSGPGGALMATPPNMLVRPGVPQPSQQQPGVPPGQQQPQQQIGQPPVSPQKDAWTSLFFEFTTLSPSDQAVIMATAGFPDRQPTSLVNEADKVCRGCRLITTAILLFFTFSNWYCLILTVVAGQMEDDVGSVQEHAPTPGASSSTADPTPNWSERSRYGYHTRCKATDSGRSG